MEAYTCCMLLEFSFCTRSCTYEQGETTRRILVVPTREGGDPFSTGTKFTPPPIVALLFVTHGLLHTLHMYRDKPPARRILVGTTRGWQVMQFLDGPVRFSKCNARNTAFRAPTANFAVALLPDEYRNTAG